MKASSPKDATTAVTLPTRSESHADTTRGRVHISPNDVAAAPSAFYRHRWQHSEHIEDFQMIAKIKALSHESKAHVKNLLDELHAKEVEAKSLREFGKSHQVFNQIWDNPDDAEYSKL